MKKILIVLVYIFSMISVMGEGKVFVLAFHTFLGNEKIDLDIDTKKLKLEMEELQKQGFKFVSMEEVKKNSIYGNKNLLITIDDGHKTVLKAYNEVLKPMKIKPVLGIYPEIIGISKSFMTWEDIINLSNDGVYIATHGYRHLKMNDKLYKENKKLFEEEIVKSKQIIKEKIGKDVDTFIYPYGIKSKIAKDYLKKSGYKYAFTINWGTVVLPINKNGDLFELPRYMYTKKEWVNEVNIIKSKAK